MDKKLKIIGIAGYIGSGKDTLGRFIQDYYQDEDYIPLDELTEKSDFDVYLQELSIFKVVKIAEPLKRALCELYGWDRKQLEDHSFKASPLGHKLGDYKEPSVRDALLYIGTKLLRNQVDENIFIDRVLDEAINKKGYKNILITDLRFKNCVERIKSLGGITIWIDRGKSSKSELKEFITKEDCDYVLENKSTLSEFHNKAIEFCEKVIDKM